MKWQKERDDLIAQTKAFVQSVTGRTPQTVLGTIFDASTSTENQSVAQKPVAPPLLPIEPVAAADQTPVTPPDPVEPLVELPLVTTALGDVRKEIQTRVAAFQAHQHRFHRERDAYFNSVLAKARSVPEDGQDISA